MSNTPDHPVRSPANGPDAPSRGAWSSVGHANLDGRIYRPEMLMIGSFARNSGKTELACRIINRYADEAPVVGLKVTTVDGADGSCPHDGEGCGVCSSLTRPWIVTRETDRESPKDTCRMLASGARHVHWLRVMRSDLAGAAADLFAHVPPGCIGVCESTSLRRVVEPGLFLLVRGADSDGAKPSARALAHLADRVVVSDGRSFDLELGRISVVDRQWVLRREACAMVVVGDDRRCEPDRTRASLEPQFDRVMVVPADPVQGDGRLSPTGLLGSPEEWYLVTPPLADGVPPALVNALFRHRSDADVVVATTSSDDRDVWLALCRRSVLPQVITDQAVGAGTVEAFGDRCKIRTLQWEAAGSGTASGKVPAAVRRVVAEAR